MTGHRSIDELYDAYLKEVATGVENREDAITLGFQYQVAKAQEKWARISAQIAAFGVVIAIAAVIVAALR